MSTREWRALRREILFFAGLLVVALADRWFLGFPSKDVLFLQREFAADAALLAEPFVSTATGWGKPVLAHPLAAFVYPFGILNVLPWPGLAVQLGVALHVVWGAVWWWLFLGGDPDARRGREGRWWLRAGVVLATLSGFVIARLGGQQGIEYVLAAAWVPQALYAAREIVRGRRARLPQVVLLAVAAAATVTLCPNLAIAAGLTVGVFAAGSLLVHFGRMRTVSSVARPKLVLAAAVVLALVMALPELLPALELIGANDGLTYGFDPAGYRFRPYSAADFVVTFTGFGEADFGRTQLLGPLSWIVLGTACAVAWRPRRPGLVGAFVLLLIAADWAAHGLGYRAVTAIAPGVSRLSISPTVEALFLWGLLGLFASATHPRRLGGTRGLLVVLALTGTLLVETRIHRGQPGYDPQREAALWAWTAEFRNVSEPVAVADVQPVSDRAYLLPDPVARAQGVRTLGEGWYSLLPRDFYEGLPARRNDWDGLDAAGFSFVVSLSDAGQRGQRAGWELHREYDATALAAEPAADRSLFRLCMAMMREQDPDWDGRVRVYRSRVPDPGELREKPTQVRPPSSWPAAGVVWPVLALVLIPLMSRRRSTRRG